MATLNTIYNLVELGSDTVLGTGIKGVKQTIKKAASIWLTIDGFEFDGTETLDETYVQSLQAEGKLIILKDVKTFADNSSDDTIETLEDGTKIVTTLGKYEFEVMFINGLAFHAALNSLNSFASYNALFVDIGGNIFGTKSTSGSLKGFSLGMLQAKRLSFPSDAAGQKEGIAFQLSQRVELDTNYIFIQQLQLGDYYPQYTDGINEVVLSWAVIPSDGDTTLVVKAKSKTNAQPFTGLVAANFLITDDGATLSKTVAETPDGTYTFTVTARATGEVLTIRLYDGAGSLSVIELDNTLYKSNIATTTVIA